MVTSQERLGALFVKKEKLEMRKRSYHKHTIELMLEQLRYNHIDIIAIIQEELMQVLPQYVEDIIKNTYEMKVLNVMGVK